MKNKAFSFVELSIVLIIIGLLVSGVAFFSKKFTIIKEERGVDNYLYNINNEKEIDEH